MGSAPKGPLSERALWGLSTYRYQATGWTWLDHLHNPAWEWGVSLLPRWLAPNTITLAALLCIVSAYTVNILYLPALQGEAPRWVYLFTAIMVFVYVNLDSMDGKQARRTGSSSPLGQLFDHGCDALGVHMMLGNIAASMGIACSWKLSLGFMGSMLPWILAHWEEYHTGMLWYGTGSFGVMEAAYAICATHLATAVWGPQLWHRPLPLPGPAAAALGAVLTVGDGLIALVFLMGLVQALPGVARTLCAPSSGAAANSIKANTTAGAPQDAAAAWGNKERGQGPAAAHLVQILAFLAVSCAFMSRPGPADECRLSISSFGLMYAHVASALIIAHMAKEPFQLPAVPALVVVLGTAARLLRPQLAAALGGPSLFTAALWLLHWAALLTYLRYSLGVVRQICACLGIRCFHITPTGTAGGKQKGQ